MNGSGVIGWSGSESTLFSYRTIRPAMKIIGKRKAESGHGTGSFAEPEGPALKKAISILPLKKKFKNMEAVLTRPSVIDEVLASEVALIKEIDAIIAHHQKLATDYDDLTVHQYQHLRKKMVSSCSNTSISNISCRFNWPKRPENWPAFPQKRPVSNTRNGAFGFSKKPVHSKTWLTSIFSPGSTTDSISPVSAAKNRSS